MYRLYSLVDNQLGPKTLMCWCHIVQTDTFYKQDPNSPARSGKDWVGEISFAQISNEWSYLHMISPDPVLHQNERNLFIVLVSTTIT